jgi:protein involved in polysaccharide export with SLBB domain
MRAFLLCLLFLLVAGCGGGTVQAPSGTGPVVYKLGPGDRLRIQTYGEERLSGEFLVDGQGRIAFPLIGQVAADDKTADELQSLLTAKLGEQALRNPRITVEVLNYRPVYILGEVSKPGEFPFSAQLRVYSLVAKAGGFTYRANRKLVYIQHAGAPGEIAYRLDSTTLVQPGDTVRIGDRLF